MDVPTVEFWFFLTPYFPELLKIRALIWFPVVSQTLSLTGLGPHSGKYGQPFSNLFKYIYIYLPTKNTYFENRYLHAVRQFCYPVCYSNAEWCFVVFFLLPLSLFICFRFSFFFCVLSCPVCVKVIFFCLKSVDTIRSMHYPPT